MTIIEAYDKYNELKAWYDAKVGAFLNTIAYLDAKIKDLKEKALTAVGAVLTNIMNKINKLISRIMKVIQAVQDFIAGVEKMIEDWISQKVAEITQKVIDKVTGAATDKATALASMVTGGALPIPDEQPAELAPVDYGDAIPMMPEMPPQPEPTPTPISVGDISNIMEDYSSLNVDVSNGVNLVVERIVLGKDYTLGRLMLDGKTLCYTCEDLDRGFIWDGKTLSNKFVQGTGFKLKSYKVHGQTAIPTGKYKIQFRPSGKRPLTLIKRTKSSQPEKPCVCDLNNRAGQFTLAGGLFGLVLFHSGNFPGDTDACLLLGNLTKPNIASYPDKIGSGSVIGDSNSVTEKIIQQIFDLYNKSNHRVFVEYKYASNVRDLRNLSAETVGKRTYKEYQNKKQDNNTYVITQKGGTYDSYI